MCQTGDALGVGALKMSGAEIVPRVIVTTWMPSCSRCWTMPCSMASRISSDASRTSRCRSYGDVPRLGAEGIDDSA